MKRLCKSDRSLITLLKPGVTDAEPANLPGVALTSILAGVALAPDVEHLSDTQMDKSRLADEFSRTLKEHAPRYDVQLSTVHIDRLREYYEHVMAWNSRLHLVAPCSPAEFATRHILESLLLLSHIPDAALIVDLGSGAGLPVIPCLIVRTDLRATLIESSPKKAVFLREALRSIQAQDRATIMVERFENVPALDADFVSCRALDRFAEMFPAIIERASPASTLLLFGGDAVSARIEETLLNYESFRIPGSERRFLFVVKLRTLG